MKKTDTYKQNSRAEALNSSQTSIGLYEMLALAQANQSKEIEVYTDRMRSNREILSKNDE